MWTLWLVTFGVVVGQGGAPPVVTPLAIYQNETECSASIRATWSNLTQTYGKKDTPQIGTFLCVPGAMAKR